MRPSRWFHGALREAERVQQVPPARVLVQVVADGPCLVLAPGWVTPAFVREVVLQCRPRFRPGTVLLIVAGDRESFTCPRCTRTSHHPEDVRRGYCGACHAYTGPGTMWEVEVTL